MSKQSEEPFIRHVHRALRHLYEPAELQISPLVAMFPPSMRAEVPSNLRKILIDAINKLKPDPRVPPDSNAWRNYQVLCFRFEEQYSQDEVAAQMALSPRQVRRLEYTALHALTETLAMQYNLSITPEVTRENSPSPLSEHKQELDWLKKSYQRETIRLEALIESVIKTSASMIQSLSSEIETNIPPGLPLITGQITTLRQVLLNILIAAVRACPNGIIQINAAQAGKLVHIEILSIPNDPIAETCSDVSEFIDLARHLIELSEGNLTLLPEKAGQILGVRLTVQTNEQMNVLAIDDNEDILQLIQRYLENTRFHLISARDPRQALELAVESQARVIILDIMLPEVDGWELLGRIRAHPILESVPVIISTILPHQQLARSLGAAAFLRKPVSREALLETLNKLI
jgi:CheY-like chemotaxis protein